MPRILIGPVTSTFPANAMRSSPECQFFGIDGTEKISIDPAGSWDDLLRQLSEEWLPDYLALWLPYVSVPVKLWQAPVPIVGLAPDWQVLWSVYRRILPRCDLVFTNAAGVERLRMQGITRVRDCLEGDRAGLEVVDARINASAFEACWPKIVEVVANDGPELIERARLRAAVPPPSDPLAALWAACSGGGAEELAEAMKTWPDCPDKSIAAGLHAPGPVEAAGCFEHALNLDPIHPIAGLNRAEALTLAGRKDDAIVQARQALLHIERGGGFTPAHVDLPRYPAGFDLFRVEWERAAWMNAGDVPGEVRAKRNLVRCRLHSLLADLSGDLAHYHEAVHARPDLATNEAALGCALARGKRFAEALFHLKIAVEADSSDRRATRALFQVFAAAGDFIGRAEFAQRQLILHKATPTLVPLEDWFEHPPLSGRERASIVILACDQLEFTRLCLESVLRHTGGDYELILVDNGSTDATPAFFEEVRARPGPARVEIVRNESNEGFAAGVNQGLAVARGEFLVLLNNDTVVTPGWLEDTIGWSLHDWPKVGLVGPLSNHAPPPQWLEPGYTALAGLDAFARQRRRAFAGQALEVPRLTGFCLLVRRAALEAIGGRLDERFGLGFFEDDDMCQEARKAGFKLLAAQNVYVHHFGGRTFAGLGIDAAERLRDNFQRFRDKWGQDAAAPYRLPDRSPLESTQPALATSPSPLRNGRSKISLCMMVKNEEKNLADCLGPIRELVDEVVIVDTGSTDRTKQLAAALGARVFDSPWQDSFSAARNASIERAHGEWIFWMDADDRIDAENAAKLKKLFASLDGSNRAYVMKCLCVASAPGETATVVDHIRLFRNDPRLRWKYRVHEQILPAIRSTQGNVRWSDVVILHTGYTDPPLRRKKLERDLRLLNLERQEQPDDPFTLFNLGSVNHELNQPQEALPVLRRSLEKSHPQDSIVRKLYALIAQSHRQLGQNDEALATCVEGRKHYPADAELLFMQSVILKERGDRSGSEELLKQLIAGKEEEHFASVDTGLRGYKARHNLAVIYLELGRYSEAEAQWRMALLDEPVFFPAHVGIGETFLHAQEWLKLDDHAEAMSRLGPRGEEEGLILQGQARMRKGEFSAARGRFQMAAQRFPNSPRIKQLLADAFLREGLDDFGAERALRDVLALDPDNAAAKQNLQVLLGKRR